MTTSDSERCRARVYSGLSIGFTKCSNRAKNEGYCTRHHPDYIAARKKEKEDRWAAKWEQERAARDAPGKRLAELEARCAEMTEILRSFTASQYIKAQHPIRYSRAMRALGAAK